MFRNNKVIRTRPVEQSDLVLARTDTFYFLEFVEYTKDIFDSTKIRSKPTVIFYTEDAVNKVIIDYTLASGEDRLFLRAFFARMAVDEAFSLTNGQYLDDTISVDADVSSSLKFKKFTEDLVFAEVVSTTSKDSSLDQYVSNYFINTPQLTKAGTLQESTDTKIKALVSRNPKYTSKPLLFLGYQPGDVIEILCPESQNNTKKFIVEDAAFLNDKEVIYLEQATNMVTENLTGKMGIVNLYVPSKVNINTVSEIDNSTDLGCAIDSANSISLPYQTKKQATLRGEQYVWIKGTCSDSTINLNGAVTNSLTSVDSVYAAQAQEIFDTNVAYLKNGLNINESDALTAFFKKKTITDSTSNLVNGTLSEEVFSASIPPDPGLFKDPFEQFLDENILKYSVPVVLDSKVKSKATQAFLPGSIFQDIQGISMNDIIAVQTERTNIYKLLNISYEAVITDKDIRLRTMDGVPLNKTNIKVNKNIITTIYETSLIPNERERLVFSSSPDKLVQVLDFGQYGYGYVQLGRYHLFTPIRDPVSPLYLFTNNKKTSTCYIDGIAVPALLQDYSY